MRFTERCRTCTLLRRVISRSLAVRDSRRDHHRWRARPPPEL